MRVGKKLNKTTDIKKKTRSCVVRLERLSHDSFSPNTSPTSNSRRSLNSLQQQQKKKQQSASPQQSLEKVGMVGVTPRQQQATGGIKSAAAAQTREGRNLIKTVAPIQKRITGNSQQQQTPQQQQQKSTANMSALRSNQKIRSVPKSISRGIARTAAAASTPASSKAATPVREETPTPTIAAGRSRRAIKPNPKYASEDMVTPKMVRNVGATHASAAKTQQATTAAAAADKKGRKNSVSSDDFYNRNSEDEYEEDGDMQNLYSPADTKGDKAYRVDDKEESLDSDISELEEEITKRSVKSRGRPRQAMAQQSGPTNKSNNQQHQQQQTSSGGVKRLIQTPVRTVPTQLQQLRRSLQSANAQRNQNLLAGSGAQKRKLAAVKDPNESDDSDDDGETYTVARKQMLVTTASGLKLRMPVRDNANTPMANKQQQQRIVTGQKLAGSNELSSRLSLNGGNRSLHTQLIDRKKIIESNKSATNDAVNNNNSRTTNIKTLSNKQNQQASSTTTTTSSAGVAGNRPARQNTTVTVNQKNILGSGVTNINRVPRTSSPKPPLSRKEASNNSSSSSKLTNSTSSTQSGGAAQKKLSGPGTKPIDKLKSALASSVASASSSSSAATTRAANNSKNASPSQSGGKAAAAASATSTPVQEEEDSIAIVNDDSPNSTMDDFETMPTFTIVNVNDIINKKGDVLITKANKNNSASTPTVLEFSESISLDDDEDVGGEGDGEGDGDDEEDVQDVNVVRQTSRGNNNNKRQQLANAKLKKSSPQTNKASGVESKKKLPLARSSGGDNGTPMVARRQQQQRSINKPSPPAGPKSHANAAKPPQILNHRLGMRNNARITAKTTSIATAATSSNPDKPAPRILNAMVAKKTQPVKPMITNLDDSAEESFPLSLDEEETEDEAESKTYGQQQNTAENDSSHYPLMDIDDTEDTESQNSDHEEPTPPPPTKALTSRSQQQQLNSSGGNNTAKKSPSPAQRKKRLPQNTQQTSPLAVTTNKKRILTPIAAKENSLAATNQQVSAAATDSKSALTSPQITPQTRKQPPEKVVISKQGDKIIKKITCFETWYVINMPVEPKRPTLIKNQLDMPLINLANVAKSVRLPNDLWNCKVTLYELSATTLAKGTFVTYMGDLDEYNINEEDRGKYQPSCVMFRRAIENRQLSRMPYDRAVIFKNKTFSTNIEGKNIRLVGAPSIIASERDIEILLEIVDSLTLQSDFVEYATILQ